MSGLTYVKLTPPPPVQGFGGNLPGKTSSGFSQLQEKHIYKTGELKLGTAGDAVMK